MQIREFDSDAIVNANRAAIASCRSRCTDRTQNSHLCSDLAERAVSQANEELIRLAIWESVDHYRAALIQRSGNRMIDLLRQLKHRMPTLPPDNLQVNLRSPHQGNLNQETSWQEVPEEAQQALTSCVEELPRLKQVIVQRITATWSDSSKLVRLDRIQDILQLIQADAALWAELQIGQPDPERRYGGAYQKFRNIMLEIHQQLKDCVHRKLSHPDEGTP